MYRYYISMFTIVNPFENNLYLPVFFVFQYYLFLTLSLIIIIIIIITSYIYMQSCVCIILIQECLFKHYCCLQLQLRRLINSLSTCIPV